MPNLCGIQSVAFATSPQSPPQNLPHKGGRSAVRDVRRPHHNQQSCRLPPPVGRGRGGGKAKAQHQTQHRAAPDLGMAQQRWSEALYPSTPPEEVLLATRQTRPPDGRSGAARRRIRALIPGGRKKRCLLRKGGEQMTKTSSLFGAFERKISQSGPTIPNSADPLFHRQIHHQSRNQSQRTVGNMLQSKSDLPKRQTDLGEF